MTNDTARRRLWLTKATNTAWDGTRRDTNARDGLQTWPMQLQIILYALSGENGGRLLKADRSTPGSEP